MKIVSLFFSIIIFTVSFNAQAAGYIIKNINGDDIAGLKIFTNKHSNSALYQNVVIQTNKIPECPSGAFLNTEDNGAIYSTVLAAKMSGHEKIEVTVDPAVTSPWGDVSYCALTSFKLTY